MFGKVNDLFKSLCITNWFYYISDEMIDQKVFKLQAPKVRTLAITIYCYRNLDLVIMIAKMPQNVLETAKNENDVLWKIKILEKELTLHDLLTQILNNS